MVDMAYLRLVAKYCNKCAKEAVYQVFNHRNMSMGHFCAEHANEEVDRLNSLEEKSGELL